jgi:putative flippase GtrA
MLGRIDPVRATFERLTGRHERRRRGEGRLGYRQTPAVVSQVGRAVVLQSAFAAHSTHTFADVLQTGTSRSVHCALVRHSTQNAVAVLQCGVTAWHCESLVHVASQRLAALHD